MNFPNGYQEMSEEEFKYWEIVVEYIQTGMTEEDAKIKARVEIAK